MSDSQLGSAIISLVIVTFIVAIFFVNKLEIHWNEQSLAQYNECKTHTTDLEWCFKEFQPDLSQN